MCGIIGCISNKPVAGMLLDGLKRLEYRGYDSAGLVVLENGVFRWEKTAGKIKDLEELLQGQTFSGTIGIGHTRWATHGSPSTCNAHPFFSCDNSVAVVHNGIIENYHQLRQELVRKKHRFQSETDTEVVVHLVEDYLKAGYKPIEAVRQVCRRLNGSFALVFMFTNHPNLLIGARLNSPLVVGIGRKEVFLASDVPAFLRNTRRVVYLHDRQIVALAQAGLRQKGKQTLHIIDFAGKKQSYHISQVRWNIQSAEKEGYAHFMLKEIEEQPEAVRRTVNYPHLSVLEPFTERLRDINRVILVACGTAWHACLATKYAMEELVRIPTEAILGSEFRYALPPLDKKTLVIAVSQSGETADTLAAVRAAKEHGVFSLAVCNVVGSTLTREVDLTLYTFAGPEISVASTKAYTAQLSVLALLTIRLAAIRKTITRNMEDKLLDELRQLPNKMKTVLRNKKIIEACAEAYKRVGNFMYIGRRNNLATAYEGALKMKEISYTHAEGYGAGEMKHGPLALVDGSFPTVAVILKDCVYEKMVSNIREIKARGGIVIAVATKGDKNISEIADWVIETPQVLEITSPILAAIPMQLLAYYTAVKKGREIDQPRNLAKSVTVE
ncbi:MAG: glutamine--fructose-6-phosphate transaminase (isomerizing) [Planctomycetota bacterium]|nr:glutamine--fructose-6-phosphate transaminase (isomerizing) [Planctomycetota bacterium]MDI6787700.1 glutamine--fructose-6-phosphate transaminase (isomerizing) [Planctomycetota bacterium]